MSVSIATTSDYHHKRSAYPRTHLHIYALFLHVHFRSRNCVISIYQTCSATHCQAPIGISDAPQTKGAILFQRTSPQHPKEKLSIWRQCIKRTHEVFTDLVALPHPLLMSPSVVVRGGVDFFNLEGKYVCTAKHL